MSRVTISQPTWMRRFGIFWRLLLLSSFALGVLDTTNYDLAQLLSGRGVVILLLLAAFLAVYEWFERSERRRTGMWPLPYRDVLIYLAIQLVIAIALLSFGPAFMGSLFALMGQVFSALPMRQWPIPIGAIIAIISVPMGLYETFSTEGWTGLAGFAVFMVSWIGIAVFIAVLFHERYERERLIAELRAARDELERYAAQAEELAALRERARLAREMHDSLGHALVLVNVKLEAAERLYVVDARRGAAELESTRALVRDSMADLRRSLANLRTALPNHQNLPAALERIAAEIRERTNIDVTYVASPDLPELRSETTEALWRVAREAMTNVERHAGAASATLTIERANGTLLLRVADDGSGVSTGDLARPGHYGLVGMRERVEALGGTLSIGKRPGGGTLVEAAIPVE